MTFHSTKSENGAATQVIKRGRWVLEISMSERPHRPFDIVIDQDM